MPKGLSPRDTKRLMKRMGLRMETLPDVQRVVFKMVNREVIVEDPDVAILDLKGQKVFQVSGSKVVERALDIGERELDIPEEDVRLVAVQTGQSQEKAKQALEETGGDLAKAILLLQTK